jgi:hypothetical protein
MYLELVLEIDSCTHKILPIILSPLPSLHLCFQSLLLKKSSFNKYLLDKFCVQIIIKGRAIQLILARSFSAMLSIHSLETHQKLDI